MPILYLCILHRSKRTAKFAYAITGDYRFRSKNLMVRFGKPFKIGKMSLEEANKKLYKEIEKLMKENLAATNRTLEEELNSRCQDA